MTRQQWATRIDAAARELAAVIRAVAKVSGIPADVTLDTLAVETRRYLHRWKETDERKNGPARRSPQAGEGGAPKEKPSKRAVPPIDEADIQ